MSAKRTRSENYVSPSEIRLHRLELELKDLPGWLREMRTEDEHHVMKPFLTLDDERVVRKALGIMREKEATFQRQIDAFYRLRERFAFPVRGFGNFVFKDQIEDLFAEVISMNNELSELRRRVLGVLLPLYRNDQMRRKIMRFNPRVAVATFILPESFADELFRKSAIKARRKRLVDGDCPALFPDVENSAVDVSRLVALYDGFRMDEFMRESEGVSHPNIQMLRAFCHYYGRGCARSYEECNVEIDGCLADELKMAEDGDRIAQANLGLYYKEGISQEEPDYTKARFWFGKSVEQGYVRAKNGLGRIYCDGHGVKVDKEKAERLFREGAETGSFPSMHNLAIMLDDDGEAFKLLRKAAEGGVGAAYVSLSSRYLFGRGVAQDYEAALRCMRKAWEMGERVLNEMGQLHLIGDKGRDGVIGRSRFTAMSREELNARCKSDVQAQTYLAFLLLKGARNVERDEAAAVALFKKAAEAGEKAAQCLLGECYYNGEGVDRDYRKAFEWFERAAQQGACQALGWMGVMYVRGQGCDEDFDKACEYMRKAVAAGNMYARQHLACVDLGYYGKGTLNYEEAVDLLWPLACDGWPSALSLLAGCYNEGKGVVRNPVKANCLLSLAAASGDECARDDFCYSYGVEDAWWSVLRQRGWKYEIDSSIVEMMASER